VIIDASPCNTLDATALEHLASLRQELAARGIALGYAGVRQSLYRTFNTGWLAQELRGYGIAEFPTLDAATRAFEQRRVPAMHL
jgi:hypothetical protein